MLVLILLGLLATELGVASGWFWGIYIVSWILKVITLIVGIIFTIITSVDKDKKLCYNYIIEKEIKSRT